MDNKSLSTHKILYEKAARFGFRRLPSFAASKSIKENIITVVDIDDIRKSKKKRLPQAA